jgi:hypothetical protein
MIFADCEKEKREHALLAACLAGKGYRTCLRATLKRRAESARPG